MKTRSILSILAATAIFAGCAKENASENIPELGENQFFATIEDGAKTILNREVGDKDYNKIFWENGDIVNINGSQYTVDPLEEDPRRALFTLADGEPAPTKLPYMAYYPYQLGGLVLPSGYSYVKENPFRGVFPMFAISSGSRNLMFKNICGLLEIKLTGTGTITRLTVSDENLPLSGKYAVDDDANAIITKGTGGINIDCGEDGVVLSDTPTVFYVPVPKGTYTKLTVSAIREGGEAWSVSAKESATIERNKVYSLNFTVLLPEGYIPVEYIETAGYAYIDTGVKLQDFIGSQAPSQLELDLAWTLSGQMQVNGWQNNPQIGINSGNTWQNYRSGSEQITLNTRYNTVLDFKDGFKLKVPGFNPISPEGHNNSSQIGFCIGAFTNTISVRTDNRPHEKIYQCKIYLETLAHHYIPCKRISDNVYGLYDVVQKEFKPSIGTAQFTGPIE